MLIHILLAVVAQEYQRTEISMWVHEINLKCGGSGRIFSFIPWLAQCEKKILNYFRMLADKFFELIKLLPLKKKDTNYCKSISSADRVAVIPLPSLSAIMPHCHPSESLSKLASSGSENQHLMCRTESSPIQCGLVRLPAFQVWLTMLLRAVRFRSNPVCALPKCSTID